MPPPARTISDPDEQPKRQDAEKERDGQALAEAAGGNGHHQDDVGPADRNDIHALLLGCFAMHPGFPDC